MALLDGLKIAGTLAVVLAVGERAAVAAAPVDAIPGAAEPTAETTASPNAGATGRGSAISLQGGWWSLEAEWRARSGLYAAVGVPWVALPIAMLNGATWVAPLGARVGYQYSLSARWSLRGSAHAAFVLDDEDSNAKCGCASDGALTQRTFVFAEAGIRYQAPSGFVAGADLPVYGLRLSNHPFPPPESLAFAQAYIGYSWGR
jgi:hypothetical protein